MSENEYVATAAAQKRLREVLTGYLGHIDSRIVETFADALLAVAQIEYKPRAKAVLISLPLPDKAALSVTGTGMDLSQAVTETAEPVPSDGYPDKQSYDEAQLARVYGGEQETVQAPPVPHIAPFAPKHDPDAEYEDVHYD